MSSSVPVTTAGFHGLGSDLVGQAAKDNWKEKEPAGSRVGDKRRVAEAGQTGKPASGQLSPAEAKRSSEAASKHLRAHADHSGGASTALSPDPAAKLDATSPERRARGPGPEKPERSQDAYATVDSPAEGGASASNASAGLYWRASGGTPVVSTKATSPAFLHVPAPQGSAVEPRTAPVWQVSRSFEAPAAAGELYHATRNLPPAAAAAWLERNHAGIVGIVDRLFSAAHREPGGERSNVRDAKTSAVSSSSPEVSPVVMRALANVALALNAGAGFEGTARLARSLGAAVLDSPSSNDKMIFGGLAQGVAVGTGLVLPLAIAQHLRDREESSRARQLYHLMALALGRMQGRIDDARSALAELIGPLVFEWEIRKRDPDEERRVDMLADFLQARPEFLIEFADRLDRVGQAGRESVLALEALAGTKTDTLLTSASLALADEESTRFVIVHSPPAHSEILRMVGKRVGDAALPPTLDAVKLVFRDIGFSAPHDAFMADEVLIRRFASPLQAGWKRLEDLDAVNEQGGAFQRLLAFLDGRFVVPASIETLQLSDIG